MLLGLLMFAGLIATQHLVVTNRERLAAICRVLVDASMNGDVKTIGENVAARFEVRGIDREAFLEAVQRTLDRVHIENARLRGQEIEVSGNRATVRFSVICRLVTPDLVHSEVHSAWEAQFERTGGVWRLMAVDPRRTPLFPFSRLEDLVR